GRLAGSLFAEPLGPSEAVAGARAPYAGALEFGTRTRPARPFLLPAFLLRRRDIIATVARAVIAAVRTGRGR
ncbi:MAG: hypothetical protein HXY25_05560, partial [Alphaproteobacteria bacterium]|nr:hypothetical protein [Alphaproteobacteria bacterium]